MGASTRLNLCIVVIVGSAIYALLVAQAPDFAEAVALGYIAVLLTILVAINLWKKE